jgi:AAA domain
VKADAADTLRNEGADGVRNRHDRAKPYKPGNALAFTLYDDIETAIVKKWTVWRFLGAGESSAFFGPPGCGKSVFVEDLGLHVAADLLWFGRKVTKGAVVYVALERRDLVKRRAVAFRNKHGLKGLPFAVTGGTVVDFRDPKAAGLVSETIRQVETATRETAALLIIDTVSRALAGGDENSSKDMGALVATLTRIHELHPAIHILLLHHVPQDADRLRGHGALLGALDATVSVAKHDGHRTATVIKANDGGIEGEHVDFTLTSVEVGRDNEGFDTTAPVVIPAATTDDQHHTTPRPKDKRQRKPSKGDQVFNDAFNEAISTEAVDIRVMGDGPATKATNVQHVRAQFCRRYVTGEADPEKRAATVSKAFRRALGKNTTTFATETRGDVELIWKISPAEG